ncbi:hypothetical protein [Brachyspira murdochii]|uniref:Uncharacterized protein n=1 Tax=Brachyspira murdochii (strain ATCC 51284 / DSM 12563 / 56-150) TaxID=526224 RepID=D5UAS6_BRAM5|nr:hypothetical protein [Brachyspira murdochii]ADG71799.1 hypothetical protein Bmur_1714 [Brachyspira murdochii DSM 12563]
MREVNFIENNGVFGITFTSDDKAEANTIMNAIQRFILKNSSNGKKENIDFSVCPIGEYKGTVWILINTISLKQYLLNYNLQEGYRNRVIEELKKRGEYIDDNNIEEVEKPIKEISRKTELENKIQSITNGRAYNELTDEELEKIIPLDKELSALYNTTETAKHILQGRKFNKSRELENKITQGRRLSELTIDELKELNKVTMNDHYKEDIQKEIDKRENKSFEETLKENNEIMSFSEDEEQSNYKIIDEDEDPLSVDTDNINNWDFDADGDKVDSEGNKMLFDY